MSGPNGGALGAKLLKQLNKRNSKKGIDINQLSAKK
jgi:hypothetical protein